MTAQRSPAVTPLRVREGDPAALRAIATRRGAAVLAFAQRVAPAGTAVETATDAFARFRGAVLAAPEGEALEPDGMLQASVRAACADRIASEPGACAHVRTVLIEPEPADGHVRGCPACRRLAERLASAGRAYLRAAGEAPPAGVAARIVAAMAAVEADRAAPEVEPRVTRRFERTPEPVASRRFTREAASTATAAPPPHAPGQSDTVRVAAEPPAVLAARAAWAAQGLAPAPRILRFPIRLALGALVLVVAILAGLAATGRLPLA